MADPTPKSNVRQNFPKQSPYGAASPLIRAASRNTQPWFYARVFIHLCCSTKHHREDNNGEKCIWLTVVGAPKTASVEDHLLHHDTASHKWEKVRGGPNTSSHQEPIFSVTGPVTCHGPIPEGRVRWPHYTLQVPPLHNSALGSTLLQALLQTTAARLMSHNFVWQSFNLFLNHDCSWMELPMAPSAMALDVVVTENLGPAQGCEHRMLLMCGFPAASFSIQTCCSLSCRSGQAKQCQQCYLRQLTQIWGSHMLGIGVFVVVPQSFFALVETYYFNRQNTKTLKIFSYWHLWVCKYQISTFSD